MNRYFLRYLLYRKSSNSTNCFLWSVLNQNNFPFTCSNTKTNRICCCQYSTLKQSYFNTSNEIKTVLNVPSKCLSTNVTDLKDDPETKALLKEIQSDFEHEKVSHDVNKGEHGENNNDNSTVPDFKESLNESNVHKDTQHNPELSFDETRGTSITLKRGRDGVFDLEELVTVLREENGQDIAVIEIPLEARYADHMVIVSALSLRHLRNISSRVKWIHKQKKDVEDPFLKVEGFESAPEWHAMDLGNIILHIFMPDTREYYDLETLWTNWGQPGHEVVEDDPYEIGPEDEFWLHLEAQKQEEKDPK